MSEVVEMITKFQGILGAIIGVIATLIATNFLKNLGKTYFYFHGWNIEYIKYDKSGGREPSNLNEAEYCNYFFEMEIINTSENLKALRDIKVKFYNSNKLLLETIPYDDSTKRVWTGGNTSDPLKIINLPAKLMVHYKVSGDIQEEDLKKLKNYNKIYLEAFNHRGKRIKKLIERS
jgi:hypothetical protein